MVKPCPICATSAETGSAGDGMQIRCPRCGPYVISGTARAMLHSRLDDDERASARISHAVRTHTTEENWFRIDSTNLDELAKSALPSVEAQTLNFLQWLAEGAGDDAHAAIEVSDYEALAGVVGTIDGERVETLQTYLEQKHLVEFIPEDCLRITPDGWGLLEAKTSANTVPSEPTQAVESVVPVTNPAPKVERSTCPKCGPDRQCEVVAFFGHTEHDNHAPMFETTNFSTLRCRGCGEIHIRRDVYFSENEDHVQDPYTGEWETIITPTRTYWPPLDRRKRAAWTFDISDPVAVSLLDEIYRALNGDMRTLAAMGVRSLLDRTFELAGADAGTTFGEKLDALSKLGVIGSSEKATLTVMTDAGSAASHRGWKPEVDDLDTLIDAAESVLHRVLVLTPSAERLKAQVPPRPKRRGKGQPD